MKLSEDYFWSLSPLEFRLLENHHDEQYMKRAELTRDIIVDALVNVEIGKATGRLRLKPLFKKISNEIPKETRPIEDDILAIAQALEKKGGGA